MTFDHDDLLRRIILWAKAQAAAGAAVGAPLDEAGLALARKIGVAAPEQVRVVTVDLLPMPKDSVILDANKEERLMDPSMAGLTLDHTLFLRQACSCPLLLAHELRHVHQVEEAGSIDAFLTKYLAEFLAVGYDQAPLEVDAREWALRALQAP